MILLLIGQLYGIERMARARGVRREACESCGNTDHDLCWSACTHICPKFAMSLAYERGGRANRLQVKGLDCAHPHCGKSGSRPTTITPNAVMRRFAAGRAHWTFFGSDRGARTAAVLRSFVTSCELVKLDPFAWLSRIAEFPIIKLIELLPIAGLLRPRFCFRRLHPSENLVP